MSARENVEVVKTWFQRLADGDYARMHELQTRDVVWDCIDGASTGTVPWLGRFSGRKGIDRCLSRFAAAVETEVFELDAFLTDGRNKVAVPGRCRLCERSTGRRFTIDFVEYFELRRGKISFVRVYGDSAAAQAVFKAPHARRRKKTTARRFK
ncbi:MAG: nuclear transport factor 2 family protein [Alphaproteobacteria bacterium]